jgi:hypothetical protein
MPHGAGELTSHFVAHAAVRAHAYPAIVRIIRLVMGVGAGSKRGAVTAGNAATNKHTCNAGAFGSGSKLVKLLGYGDYGHISLLIVMCAYDTIL